jgi:hypothetical protein
MFKRSMLASLVVAVTALVGVAPANAATLFSQTNASAQSYWASKDFVPTAGAVYIGGSAASGGSARYFYVQLVTTSGSNKVFSSYSWPANGATYSDNRLAVNAAGGVAYYIRWYGQDGNLNNGYTAPSSSVNATR